MSDDATRADDAMERYLASTPGALDAFQHDPTYHAFATQLRHVLHAVDTSMKAEGISEDARDRVIASVVNGALDEDAAAQRRAELAAQAQTSWERLARSVRERTQ